MEYKKYIYFPTYFPHEFILKVHICITPNEFVIDVHQQVGQET